MPNGGLERTEINSGALVVGGEVVRAAANQDDKQNAKFYGSSERDSAGAYVVA